MYFSRRNCFERRTAGRYDGEISVGMAGSYYFAVNAEADRADALD